jgi:transcriptional regulator with XRE-family HTH domain
MTPAQCRAARALLDWSQQQLATIAGVGIVTVRQFEAGIGVPRLATTELLMNTFERVGLEFVAGNGGGPGVRAKQDLNSQEQFLAFLKLYEHARLRRRARQVGAFPEFGYVFVYHDLDGADLMHRGDCLGHVRWRNGHIAMNPEPTLPEGMEISLSDEVFDQWVARAEYKRTTSI